MNMLAGVRRPLPWEGSAAARVSFCWELPANTCAHACVPIHTCVLALRPELPGHRPSHCPASTSQTALEPGIGQRSETPRRQLMPLRAPPPSIFAVLTLGAGKGERS